MNDMDAAEAAIEEMVARLKRPLPAETQHPAGGSHGRCR